MQKKWLALATALLMYADVAHLDNSADADDIKASPTRRGQKITTTPAPALLACNMGAMTPAQRKSHDKIGKQLRKAVKEVKELPDGYAFRYAPDPVLFMATAEFITLESRCCSFYHFRLEKEPGEGPMWLRITGSKEAKPIIKAVLAP
jgi:hypothetical protein